VEQALFREELGLLAPGHSYVWQVEARAKDGKVLGAGRGFFDL
jgi:hypothetical protein